MRRRFVPVVALGAAVLLGAAAVGAVPTVAVAQAPNSCPADLGRWGPLRGAPPMRGSDFYRQADNGTTNPSFYLPQQVVVAGQSWRFGYGATVEAPAGASAQARVEVDWYSTPAGNNTGYLGHVDGPWVAVPVDAGAVTAVGHVFTAPAGAVRADVLTDLEASTPRNTWTGRACDYRLQDGMQPPGDGDTAAGRHAWGRPLARWSDEFDYGSASAPAVPDQAKWQLAGDGVNQCWPGHAGNGRRCDVNTRVAGGILRQTGEADGDTGWLASRFGQRYGRWEARVRSQATGPDNGRRYHPLLILWPDSEQWPQDGEYDYLENSGPGQQCAEAFLHYPHNANAPMQQEFARRCGVDLAQWHNIAVEWTPSHVRGFVDGVPWFSFSGGANAIRQCIQCAPSMHQTIQLDNFHGTDLQPAVFEVDWLRVYPLDPVSALPSRTAEPSASGTPAPSTTSAAPGNPGVPTVRPPTRTADRDQIADRDPDAIAAERARRVTALLDRLRAARAAHAECAARADRSGSQWCHGIWPTDRRRAAGDRWQPEATDPRERKARNPDRSAYPPRHIRDRDSTDQRDRWVRRNGRR